MDPKLILFILLMGNFNDKILYKFFGILSTIIIKREIID